LHPGLVELALQAEIAMVIGHWSLGIGQWVVGQCHLLLAERRESSGGGC
jgi:hypothetical protein